MYALREKCSDTKFYLVRIFLYSDGIRRFAEQMSVFSPNTGKYGVNFRIQSEYRQIRARKKSAFGHFSRSDDYIADIIIEKNSLLLL